ncbi:MAG: DMT family transporter [Enhydrobacter sp.]
MGRLLDPGQGAGRADRGDRRQLHARGAVCRGARARRDEPLVRRPAWRAYAVLSGAITSGLGYALWYAALPALSSTSAAIIQLSVPAIAALGGVVLLSESLTVRLLIASAAILGGIAITTAGKRR